MRRLAVVLLGAALVAPAAVAPPLALAGDESLTDDSAQLRMVAPGGASHTSTFAALSDDGEHIFFNTAASINGSPGGGVSSVFDFYAGHYKQPVAPIGPSGIGLVAASADGRYQVITSLEQLLPDDTNSLTDWYWVDGSTLKLIDINGMAPQPPKGNGGTPVPALIAPDGSRVIFNTAYPLVDEDLDNENDLYDWIPSTEAWHYLTPGATWPQGLIGWTSDLERVLLDVSDTLMGTQIHNNMWEVSDAGFARIASGGLTELSPDGERVYFFSQEGFVPGDTDDDWDSYELGPGGYRLLTEPAVGVAGLLEVSDDGQTWLISTLASLVGSDTDGQGDVYRMRTGQPPELITGGTVEPTAYTASDDASTLFYRTTASLVGADTDSADDLYRWKAGGGTTLVTPGVGTASVVAMDPAGDRVILSTGVALVPSDTDGATDLYRFSGTSTYANLSPGTGSIIFVKASRDAKRVLFRTSAKLVPTDTNIYQDLYVSDLDVTPPTPTVTGPTTGTSSSASYTVGSVGNQARWLECQVDGGAWARCQGTNQLNGLSLGSHSVAVHGWDAVGNKSASPATVVWEVIAPDGVAPTVTAPVRSLTSGSAIASGMVPVKLTWSGSDAGSGIARYELQKQVDGGSWANVQTTLTVATKTVNLAPGHAYGFRARSVDKASNVSAWATGTTFTLTSYQQTSSKVVWAGTWTTVTDPVYWGGSARASSKLGSTATFTATGRSIAFVSRKGTSRGKAEIYVNGVKVATVDLYASASQNQRVVWVGSWSTSASRIVKVRVLATSGRPRVDVDAFLVLN